MGHLTPMQIIRNSLLKLLFEGLGAMFLTLTFNCTLKRGFVENQTAVLLTLWVLSIFGLKISGAHYNPAITVSFMIRKDTGSFPRVLGFAYILVQCFGAFIGALIAWFLLPVDNGVINAAGNITIVSRWGVKDVTAASVFAAMIAEPLGTFFVSFFYLT